MSQTDKDSGNGIHDYRYDETRKNNPPAGLAAQGRVAETPKFIHGYDPHLPPVLRFDQTGQADRLDGLLADAKRRRLTDEEVHRLSQHTRPWLEWAGKREKHRFEVDPVALHVHERVSARAIVRAVKREDIQRDLFADPQLPLGDAVKFYQHDVDWSNRLILGDSLQVMASLAKREALAGQVQTIYIDPPYGIRFKSNFQPKVGDRTVGEREADLTREVEMVKAYRDTWRLGIHSYLDYLRDRFVLARELLTDSGSIFVQISDENLHLIRNLLDEVFGPECFVVTFPVKKKGSQKSGMIDPVNDYLIWYGKSPRNSGRIKFRPLFQKRELDADTMNEFSRVELANGAEYTISALPNPKGVVRDYRLDPRRIFRDHPGARLYTSEQLKSGGHRKNQSLPFSHMGRTFEPGSGSCWKTTVQTDDGSTPGMEHLAIAGRLRPTKSTWRYKRFLNDFGYQAIGNWWDGLGGTADLYVVQTNPEIVKRCILMTSDPGDLVLDPTCGSGTTAYTAERWGRRWITIDTSRVAVAIARQRLLTSTFPHYRVRNEDDRTERHDPGRGFVYKTVPHIMLGDIANNAALDSIEAKHRPILNSKLDALNAALKSVTPETRSILMEKLADKRKEYGKRTITDADERRWHLPKSQFEHWTVPFDVDEDYPPALAGAIDAYREAWRAKRDDVDAAIAAGSERETLYDRPEIEKGIVRVSGPFTVEAVMPAELTLDEPDSPIGGAPDDFDDTFGGNCVVDDPVADTANAEAYLDKMVRLLRDDGVRFLGNNTQGFDCLNRISDIVLHADGEWTTGDGTEQRVAVSFGPEHGPVTAQQVEEALRAAYRRGYDALVFAGFTFDGAAQAVIQDDPNPAVRIHMANIAPDVMMDDLLKKPADAQLFTVFGQPRTRVIKGTEGRILVAMEGMDVYDPVKNALIPTKAQKVAAWFIDHDYDGRTFCISQACFPIKLHGRS